MKRSIILLLIFLAFSGPFCWSQNIKYLEDLGKEYHINTIKKWAEDNDGLWVSSPSNPRYYGVLLPKFGMSYDHDYNKVNGATVITGIEFGRSSIMRARFAHINDTDQFQGYGRDLPFGLKIGMSRTEVEVITGSLTLSKSDSYPGDEQVIIPNLPGFRGLELIMAFENQGLVYFKIQILGSYSQYQKRIKKTAHPMRMSLAEAIKEKTLTKKKLNFGSFTNGMKALFSDDEEAKKEREDHEVLQAILKHDLRTDSVIYTPNEGYTAVWCTTDIKDKEAFFDELHFYLNVTLDSRYLKRYEHLRVKDYKSGYINAFEYYYYHPDDGSNYQSSNSQFMFHAYILEGTNEVVLNIYEPGERTETRKKYMGVCNPENPDLLLSDKEYLAKLGVDVVGLKEKYEQYPGNALLRIMDGRAYHDVQVSATGLELKNGYNEETSKSWSKGVEFKLDKEFSRSVYKGELPLGFKKGMSISKIKDIFPEFDYSKSNAKKNWFTTYLYGKIINGISITYTVSFRKGKLGRLVVEMDESSANSRAWVILKPIILPELNPSVLK